ncbi:MAG: hypothetical protein N2689_18630, partial [Verrucomicrobiae bacterium]|nr:hypothetical protein [Verrucomicrobiae bacterium]
AITAGSQTSNTVTVRFNSPGASSATATLTVTETSPFGCQGTATQTVTVQPAPTPVITGNTNVCGYLAQYDGVAINNTETYVVSDANGINYTTANITWTLPAGGGTFTGASSGVGVTTGVGMALLPGRLITWLTNTISTRLAIISATNCGCRRNWRVKSCNRFVGAPTVVLVGAKRGRCAGAVWRSGRAASGGAGAIGGSPGRKSCSPPGAR